MPDPRPEGMYWSWSTYPPQGGPYSARLLRIERVHGDGSVRTLDITAQEAKELKAALEQAHP